MIKVYYRYNSLDKEHEYGVVLPETKLGYINVWNLWFWYFMGQNMKRNEHRQIKKRIRILTYAYTYDENCKIIKEYKDTWEAERCAKRVINFIRKHSSKKNNNHDR